MIYHDKNGQEIKAGQSIMYENQTVDTVVERKGKLYIICQEIPEKLWAIDDFTDDKGFLEDYIIMERKI